MTVDTINRAPDEGAHPSNITPIERARRLYAAAALIERRSPDELCRETAGRIRELALDLMVEARIAEQTGEAR